MSAIVKHYVESPSSLSTFRYLIKASIANCQGLHYFHYFFACANKSISQLVQARSYLLFPITFFRPFGIRLALLPQHPFKLPWV